MISVSLTSLSPVETLKGATIEYATTHTTSSSSLLFVGEDAASISSHSIWLSSPTRRSSSSSSSSSGGGGGGDDLEEETLDMCQLVENGLLDSIDEGKAELATKILENLDELMDLEEWIKSEEPFSNWLEDKTMMSMLSASPLPTFGEVLPEPVITQPQTHNLLREFESVLDSVEELGKQQQKLETLKELDQLTPPESPHEPMDEVEALVRRRAEEQLLGGQPSSPSSLSSSSSHSYESDYNPSPMKHRQQRKVPYSLQHRNVEERRYRKKEQNKNAATRYRQKKKAEVEEIVSEERDLQRHNEQLIVDVTDVQREIKYLKSLMRDLFKAKNLL